MLVSDSGFFASLFVFGVSIGFVFLTGCERYPREIPAEAKDRKIEQRLDALENAKHDTGESLAFARLNLEFAALQAKVDKLSMQKAYDDLIRDSDTEAYLTPGDNGYSVVRTNFGILVINLVNVEDYASGSRVTLRFGNLTSGSIEGVGGTLEWGKVDAKGAEEKDATHSREMTLNDELSPATWIESSFNLEAITPKELGFVRVKGITHTGIKLRATTLKK